MADPLPLPNELGDTAGISDEDRRDIVAQIDRVTQQNRIQMGPEVFVLRAQKKGLLVPLAVNLGAVVVLALGLGTLWLLFRQSADTLVQNQVILQTTEGKLLEEIKKEAESQLLAKDQQIADIQKRMDALAQQKNDLQSTMETKIATREQELKAQLQKTLDDERARLTQAGYTQSVIEEKLKAFEKQKTAEFQAQMAEFRKKADAERVTLEANLKKQQDDFQKNISDLAGERQRILDDSKKKQGELQAQLDQKTKDLEAQQSASRAQLAQAQQQLADLNDQRNRTETVQNQLQGFYTKISQTIQSRQFPEAMNQVQTMVAFLNDATVKGLPEIQKRRDADLLLLSTLRDWLDQDQKRLDADSARVQVTTNALEAIQSYSAQAQTALAAGKTDDAEAFYTKALGQVPAVLEAHGYFLSKSLKAEQARQTTLLAALDEGEAALAAGKSADALKALASAVEALPLTPSQKAALADQWTLAAYDSELTRRNTELDDAAKKDLAAAQVLAARSPSEGLAAYTALLGRYPVGQIGFAGLTGIRQVAAALRAPSAKEQQLTAQWQQVQQDLTTTQQALADAQKSLAARAAEVASLQQKLTQPQTPANDTGASKAALEAAQTEASQLRPAAVALKTMSGRFQDFLTQDNPLWNGTPDSSQILQSKLLLNGFLASPEVSSAFPGLADRMSRYEKSAMEAGQREGLINLGGAVSNLAGLESPAERSAYLKSLERRFAGNDAMTRILSGLETLVSTK